MLNTYRASAPGNKTPQTTSREAVTRDSLGGKRQLSDHQTLYLAAKRRQVERGHQHRCHTFEATMRCAGCCRRFAAWDAAIDPPADAGSYPLSRASPLKIFSARVCIGLAEFVRLLCCIFRESLDQIQGKRWCNGDSATAPRPTRRRSTAPR